MSKEELGKLSTEQLNRLGRVISEAKDLTNQQAEIIEKVLSGEEDIGKLRISYLEQYFDTYSKNLDLIARKHSALNDTFLVLDGKLNDNYKALASDVAKLEKQLKALSKSSSGVKDAGSTEKKTSSDENDTTKNGGIQGILHALDSGVKLDKSQFQELLSTTKNALSNIKLDKEQYQTLLTKLSGTLIDADSTGSAASVSNSSVQVSHEYKDHDANLSVFSLFQELYDRSIPIVQSTTKFINSGKQESIAEEIAATSEKVRTSEMPGTASVAVSQEPPSVAVSNIISEQEIAPLKETESSARRFLSFLDGVATDGIAIYTQEASIKSRQLENNKALLESWVKREKEIRESMLNLAIAKLQTQEELENRAIEVRLARLKEATDAELAAQKLLNQIDLQLAPDTSKGAAKDLEIGDNRVRKTDADLNLKAYQELEKQMADYRAKLDLEVRLKNNGKIKLEEAAANEEAVRKYFAARKDAIIKEARDELLAKEQLARLSKTNPQVAQEYEKRLAAYKAKLDLESMRANNGLLTEEAIRANEITAQKYFGTRREELLKEIAAEQLARAELAEATKNDPSVAKEYERQLAEYRANLDLESRRANNGILSDEEAERNKALALAKFESEKETILKKIALEQVAEADLAKLKENNSKLVGAREDAMAKYRAKLELESRKKNNGILTADEAKRIKELTDTRYKLEGKEMEKLAKRKLKDDKKEAKRESRKQIDDVASTALSKDNNLIDRVTALSRATDDKVTKLNDDDGGNEKVAKAIAGLDTAMTLLSDLAKRLDGAIDKIGSFQGTIDTRLQGSSNKQHSGSYWGQLTRDMMSVGAVTPFFKQEKFAENIKSLVEKGISFDLKQRAFLMTIQEKIANTFNVADGTLLRLIRIQQEDSTAGRLGMESALNSFLNNMYETSEYLSDVAASVRGNLEEMESLMKGAEATEVEYQVQKWMGSLYSVGMSQNAVTAISGALGQIASGQVDALMSGGAGNLIVMAANEAGLSIADILTEGLDAENTNRLLQATVNYLADIAESSKGNNVVQQQLANVFGVKASDLRAATNLAEPGSTNDIFKNNLSYGNMIKQLNNMAKTMGDRTSWGEKLTNIWENGEYTLASSLANSPAAYLIYKLAGLLDDAVGGIALPFINVMGFGVDLNTTVADLMRVAAMTGGILSNLGPMVSGLASSFSGQAMLSKMGIGKGSGLEVTHRGSGDGITASNSGGGSSDTSGSGYIGQSNGSDIKNSTVKESEDSKKKQMIKAKEEEPANQVDVLNNTVIKIYELLDGVAKGSKTLRVRVDNYGLTGANSSSGNTALSGSGSTDLLGSSPGASGSSSNSSSSSGSTGFSSSGTYGSGNISYGSTGNYGSTGSYGSDYSGSGGSEGYGSSGSGVGSGSIDLGGWSTV